MTLSFHNVIVCRQNTKDNSGSLLILLTEWLKWQEHLQTTVASIIAVPENSAIAKDLTGFPLLNFIVILIGF